MWRWSCLSVLIALGVESAHAADRDKDVGFVPKAVRTIPIPANNEPAWSSRWVDLPTALDTKASSQLIIDTARNANVVPPPVQATEVGAAVVQPPARRVHIDPFNVLGVVAGVLISLAIGLGIYLIRARPVRSNTPRLAAPGQALQPPRRIMRRNRNAANMDIPSVETFEREIGKVIMATPRNGRSPATPTKPFVFDPYA